jgi:hypothetical protein
MIQQNQRVYFKDARGNFSYGLVEELDSRIIVKDSGYNALETDRLLVKIPNSNLYTAIFGFQVQTVKLNDNAKFTIYADGVTSANGALLYNYYKNLDLLCSNTHRNAAKHFLTHNLRSHIR